MPVDPSRFHKLNVADTCAVWNILSSARLLRAAFQAGCFFCCTTFVEYECLIKPRKKVAANDTELKRRLKEEKSRGRFSSHSLDIADLQSIALLQNRKKVSKGELSSIAFAMKTRQAFMTDDQGARKLAERVMDYHMIQTTPHLFGWLFFIQHLSDGDKLAVISEHEAVSRPLGEYFETMYLEALRCRLMASASLL
jgi:hypothetical protein